jgi:DNA polymerase-3 subunit epsilon
MLTPVIANRIVVLDTETTGLNPEEGHRIIEIGCVELVNRRITGNRFHVYINPEREIDAGAMEVHGITNEFLQDKSVFSDIVRDFIAFIEGAQLVIHNAPFDVGFLNYEFSLLGHDDINIDRYCTVFDTLVYARAKHPGQRNSLDALCKRYSIDNSHRELHGALLDAEILADVYLLMTGGQASLLDENDHLEPRTTQANPLEKLPVERPKLTVIACNEQELAEHEQYLVDIEKVSGQRLWRH